MFPSLPRCPVYSFGPFRISSCASISVQQGSPMHLTARSCSPPQINDTSLIKSAWMRSGCHGNNYQSCLINFLNCLMIYDPMNSLISSLSLIWACTPPPPSLFVLTHDLCFITHKIRTDCQSEGWRRIFAFTSEKWKAGWRSKHPHFLFRVMCGSFSASLKVI